MKQLIAQPLSKERFEKYGEYMNLLDDEALSRKSIFPQGFFADVVKLDFGTTTLPTVSVCKVTKQERNVIRMLEAHKFTCEGLLPLDADVIIFVGTPLPGRKFSVDTVEAFVVPKGTFVKLNPLILHGTQFPVNADSAHILCMLPGRTFMNDMMMETLAEDGQAVVVAP